MKNKNLFLGLLVLAVSLFSISLINGAVNGTVAFVTPVNGTAINGVFSFNVTNVTFQRMVNCSFYARSLGNTANTTWFYLATFKNDSLTNVNGTGNNSIMFEDGSDYQLNATCYNSSTDIASTYVTIIIDNYVPTSPSSPFPTDSTVITTSGTRTFTQTINDSSTVSCSYNIYRNYASAGNDYTGNTTSTISGNNCSFTKAFTTSADNGKWCWTQIASDERNTTQSTENCISVGITPVSGGIPPGSGIDESGNIIFGGENSNLTWIIVGIIVAVLIVIILISWGYLRG